MEEELQKENPFELVMSEGTIFHKFDPAKKYYIVNNWVLIGSLGDPESWEGVDVVARKKGDRDGLAGVLVDFNILQEILYQRPSGEYYCDPFTHRLQSMLLADSNSVIGTEIIIQQITKVCSFFSPTLSNVFIYILDHQRSPTRR